MEKKAIGPTLCYRDRYEFLHRGSRVLTCNTMVFSCRITKWKCKTCHTWPLDEREAFKKQSPAIVVWERKLHLFHFQKIDRTDHWGPKDEAHQPKRLLGVPEADTWQYLFDGGHELEDFIQRDRTPFEKLPPLDSELDFVCAKQGNEDLLSIRMWQLWRDHCSERLHGSRMYAVALDPESFPRASPPSAGYEPKGPSRSPVMTPLYPCHWNLLVQRQSWMSFVINSHTTLEGPPTLQIKTAHAYANRRSDVLTFMRT